MKQIALALAILLIPFSQELLAAQAQMRKIKPTPQTPNQCQIQVEECKKSWDRAKSTHTEATLSNCFNICKEAMGACGTDPLDPQFISAQSHRLYCMTGLAK